MGQFDTDYIIFRNVSTFEKIILKENKEFDRIFENISFIEMKSSNLINYSRNMCQIDQGTRVLSMAHPKKMSRYDKLHNVHGFFFKLCVMSSR
jgi:endonuclease III